MSNTLLPPDDELGGGLVNFDDNDLAAFAVGGWIGTADTWVFRTAVPKADFQDNQPRGLLGLLDIYEEYCNITLMGSGGSVGVTFVSSIGNGGVLYANTDWIYIVVVSDPIQNRLNVYINGERDTGLIGDDVDFRPNSLILGERAFYPGRLNRRFYAGIYAQQLPVFQVVNSSLHTQAGWDALIAAEYASLTFPS